METQPKTLWEMLVNSVRDHREEPLFRVRQTWSILDIESWEEFSYGAFGQEVMRVADGLLGRGVGRGDRVAYLGPNSPSWAITAYACYSIGAAFVPMYATQSNEEWRHIVIDSDAKLFVVDYNIYTDDDATGKRIDTIIGDNVVYDRLLFMNLWMGSHPKAFENYLTGDYVWPQPPLEDDTACIIYTSGTTGVPKGVVLTHKNIVSNVLTTMKLMPITREDTCLSFLPWAHSFGQTAELHMFIARGASIAINDEIPNLIRNMGEVKPTILCAVPRIFNKLYASTQATIKSKGRVARWLATRFPKAFVYPKLRKKLGGRLRFCVSGGAKLEEEIGRFLDEAGITVYEGYGLSETSPVVSVNYPGNKKLGTVGRVIEGVRVIIDREVTGDPLLGEIIVYGPNVMRGYWKCPKETMVVMTKDGGFRTGDLGYFDKDGMLVIGGRIKEQYKLSNGKYVAPVPIEEKLKLSPLIENAMVWGDNKPYNIALIVPDMAALEKNPMLLGLIESEIENRMHDLKGYERIRRFILVKEDFTQENGLLTPTLKLKRRKVIEKYKETIEALYA